LIYQTPHAAAGGQNNEEEENRLMQRPYFRLLRLTVVLMMVFSVTAVDAGDRRYERTVKSFTVPDVMLVNQDGKKVRFKSLIESDKPVVVDFIYGTCTTICPVLSAGYSHMQKKLGEDSEKVHLVSITIDPENDSPEILKEYLDRYRAKPGWDFLTGSRKDIDRVMHSFDAYFSNKMDHQPLTFIRSPEDGQWIRLYGLLSSRDFMKECEKVGI
jgi:protein SCO1/2